MLNLDSDFNKTYEELSEINEAAQKKYEITYREEEGGPKKSFVVTASSEAEAKQIAWSKVDAEDIWVNEIREDLREANNVVRSFANNTWYSGGFRGLNDISTAVTPEERERRAKEEEERKIQKEYKEFEKAAKKSIAENRVAFFNHNHRYEISHKDYCPAIDLDTNEFVYDPDKKKEVLVASKVIVDEVRRNAAAKGLQTRAANQASKIEYEGRAAAVAEILYYWFAYAMVGTKQWTAKIKVLNNEDPEGASKAVAQKLLDLLKQEAKECKAFGEHFDWNGKITINCQAPKGEEEFFKEYSLKPVKF